MHFQKKRKGLALQLVLLLGLGLQTSRRAAGLATSVSPSPPNSASPWSLNQPKSLRVTNPFVDASENVGEEAVSQETTPDVQAPSTSKATIWRRLAILVAVGISVAVAFQFHRQTLSPFMRLPQEQAAHPDKTAQTSERLEKVRGLVKPASVIAAALNTPGSLKLVAELQENLEKADRVHSEGGAAEETESSLDAAMDCVQMLHSELVQHADAIVKGSKVISLYPLVGTNDPNPIAGIRSLEKFHEAAVSPFLQSLCSVYSVSEALSARTKEILGELRELEAPSQGDDGRWVPSTALKVNSLLSTVDAQQYLERLAKGLVSSSVSGLRVTMLAEREAKRSRLQLALDLVTVYLQQSRRSLENALESANKEESLEEKKAALSGIEEEVKDISEKVSNLVATAKNLRECKTLQDIFAVCSKSQEVEDEVSANLERILGILTEFDPKDDNLDERSKVAVEELADKYRNIFASKHEVMQRAYYDVQERVINIIGKATLPTATIMQKQSGRVAQNIREKMDQTMEKCKEEMGYGESALRELKTMAKLSAVAQVFEGLKVFGYTIVHMKEDALLQLLGLHLLNILQHDIDHIAKEGAAIASDPDYPHVDYQKMSVLQSSFNAAKEKAVAAETLQDMTSAAIAMRNYHSQIEGLLYELRRNA
ncbi:hypothetical protein, conserved [Eimeria praecox]|uniref:Transmembrane protein n=1 Tax=Eimeria praecox TaxID=51316 RepID=U6G888_9EIME|nr:hypothetical protein, conserved [Eimeria praecox]